MSDKADLSKLIEKFIADTGMEDGNSLTVVSEYEEAFNYLTGVGIVDEDGNPLS